MLSDSICLCGSWATVSTTKIFECQEVPDVKWCVDQASHSIEKGRINCFKNDHFRVPIGPYLQFTVIGNTHGHIDLLAPYRDAPL